MHLKGFSCLTLSYILYTVQHMKMLELSQTFDATKLPVQQHALVLHSPEHSKATATKYVNESLSREQLTVYLPVDTENNNNNNNSSQNSEKVPEIINYEDNVSRGSLLTLDIRPFYNSAVKGDVKKPFEELKTLLEEAINERVVSGKNDGVTIVSGIAGTLVANQKFEESISAEKWWQETHSEWLQKGLKITMICPHPRPTFDKSQLVHYKQAISSLHHVVVDPNLS